MSVEAAQSIDVTGLTLDRVSDVAGDLGCEIHLWHADLDRLGTPTAMDTCSDAERFRAAALPSKQDRKRFLVSRTLLRVVLAGYTGQAPERIRILVSDDGKPFLEGNQIHFNISHSEARVLIAVRARGEVGVDIQVMRSLRDELAIARSIFAESEIALLARLTGDARRSEFFRLWTCREAVLKTVGIGITERASDLVLKRDVRGALRVISQPPEWGRLGLREFQPTPESLGAVAWKGDESGAVLRHLEIEG